MAERRRRAAGRPPSRRTARTSWDPLAQWYDGWVGKEGSKHHRKLAIPAVLELLNPQPKERFLDVGAGQGVLAPHIAQAGAGYVGVDASPALIRLARQHHGQHGHFIQGDARRLAGLPGLQAGGFDGVVFLLSIQDMDPLDEALTAGAWALRSGGRLVLLITHPCFRIPRQSGWGWDEGRKLRYRRIDTYLTPLAVPLKSYAGPQGSGVTRSFHRPLHAYVNGLAACGLLVDRLLEIPTYKAVEARGEVSAQEAAAANRANQEFPLFLGLRAVKVGHATAG